MNTPTNLDEWVLARAQDLYERESNQSLRTVGPGKPLGSMAQHINLMGAARALRFSLSVLRRGRRPHTETFSMLDRRTAKLWIYHLDIDAFDAVMENHKAVFERWGCHTYSRMAMVNWIRNNMVPPKTSIFDAIADLYGDKTGPGRTDVLPGTPAETMLQAFERVTGTPEPTACYWVWHGADSVDIHPMDCACLWCGGAQ